MGGDVSSLAEKIRIATRSSPLAMWQSNHVADLIRAAAPECHVELVEVSTQGDQDRTSTLASMGGQGVFTREVQAAVLDGRADVAVHSLKDLPTVPIEGLTLAAVPKRASALDALVLADEPEDDDDDVTMSGDVTVVSLLAALPDRARIGTGSPRRQAQLRHYRSDLQIEQIRGNVETRLEKLDAGEFDAIVLAEAGLTRLGFQNRISMLLAPPMMYGAVGQGAIGIECRQEDEVTRTTLALISDADDFAATAAERSLMRELKAGCHAPVGTRTLKTENGLKLYGVVLSMDGTIRIAAKETGDPAEPERLGVRVAYLLCQDGAEALLAHCE
jgi:hydroxymethylbilane synthase